ncbi:MAG: response regulator [bacterium]|nr:response regulator [bacterium]
MPEPLRILLVDDDPGERALVERTLLHGLDGSTVDHAVSRATLLAQLAAERYDVIITDHDLPDINGLQVIDIVDEHAVQVPLILLAGTGTEEIAIEALRRGVSDYVIKSTEHIKRLPEAVGHALRRARLEQERSAALVALRESEERYRASEARYRALVENAPEAILVLDVDRGCFVDMNENAVSMFGMDRAAIMRAGLADLCPPRQPDGRRSDEAAPGYIGRALEGECVVFEWVHRDSRGRDIPTEIRLIELPSSTRRLVRGSITDITQRKQIEEQLRHSQKMEAVGQLAGGVAHDFNNLLTAINGYADLALARGVEDPEVVEDLEEILNAGERAAALTRQLLAFSRKQIIQPRVLDLNSLIRNLMKMVRRLIGEHIELQLGLEPELYNIDADPTQIEQVVVNLAVNARDAMPGGGSLRVETRNATLSGGSVPAEVRPGDYVVLAIRDTGRGMTAETAARIFEPFFTTKERGKGTGLGLATVYGIVRQNKGHIGLDSEPENGAEFTVYLPRSDKQLDSTLVAAATSPYGTETVLLVEDEGLVRSLAARSLRSYGYTVIEAASAADALRVSAGLEGALDLVVTDVVMPGMSGQELAQRLIATHPQTKILFVSGHSDELVQEHGAIEPGIAFLQKPFSPEALSRRVRQMLDEDET